MKGFLVLVYLGAVPVVALVVLYELGSAHL